MSVDPESQSVLRVRAQVAVLADDPEAKDYIDDLLAADPEDQIGHALRGNLAINAEALQARVGGVRGGGAARPA